MKTKSPAKPQKRVTKRKSGSEQRLVSPLPSQEARPRVKSSAQARKCLYDYLDQNRPWARCTDVYDMMEAIVDHAAFAFLGEVRPKREDVKEMEDHLYRFTAKLDHHPENYDGPCACGECRSYGD